MASIIDALAPLFLPQLIDIYETFSSFFSSVSVYIHLVELYIVLDLPWIKDFLQQKVSNVYIKHGVYFSALYISPLSISINHIVWMVCLYML